MSGHKRITVAINPTEYRRLHQQEMEKRFHINEQSETAVEAETQTAGAVVEEFQSLVQRQQAFEELTSGLSMEVQAVEQENRKALKEQQLNLIKQVQINDHKIRHWMQQEMADILDSLSAQTDSFQTRAAQIEQELAVQQDDRERLMTYAQHWIETAQQAVVFIHEQYDTEQFSPGELELLEDQLFEARQNLAYGASEAALATAQGVYFDLSRLRLNLESLHQRWNIAYYNVRTQLEELFQFALDQAKVPAMDTEGHLLEVPVDVDYWSLGDYKRLLERLEGLNSLYHNQAPVLSEVEALMHQLPIYKKQIGEMVYRARSDLLNSQLRVNIADLVVEALREQGFFLHQYGFYHSDMRTTYSTHLTSKDGSEVVVQVAPKPGTLYNNEVHVYSLDKADRTEHELYQRSAELANSLRESGLQTGDLIEVKDQPAVRKSASQSETGVYINRPKRE
jgi:hypothetical protein